jgi:L-aspartate oxidase
LPAASADKRNSIMPPLLEANLRTMMTSHVGVIRDGERLAQAVRTFAAIERESSNVALRNMATTALLVAAAAWARRESRGAHYRIDYPAERPELKHRTMTTLKAAREIAELLAERAAVPSPQPMIA